MNHSKTRVILEIVAFSFTVIIVLLVMAEKRFSYRQHFIRVYRVNSMTLKAKLPLKEEYYFAGLTKDRLYFGNKSSPLSLMVADSALNVIEYQYLPVQDTSIQALEGSYVEINYPLAYVKAKDRTAIYVCNMNTKESVLRHVPYFERAVPVSKTLFVLQTQGNEKESGVVNNLLLLVSTRALHHKRAKALSADVTGFFTSQGILRYCADLHRLVYVHYYRNEIIVMDTSLNVLYNGATIDTISHAQIDPREVEKGFYSMASTPSLVNINAHISGKELYIHSNLMAANDDRALFDHASVIDVYNLETLEYTYSLYVPDYNNTKMKSFRALDNAIIVVYPDLVALYAREDDQGQRLNAIGVKYFADQWIRSL